MVCAWFRMAGVLASSSSGCARFHQNGSQSNRATPTPRHSHEPSEPQAREKASVDRPWNRCSDLSRGFEEGIQGIVFERGRGIYVPGERKLRIFFYGYRYLGAEAAPRIYCRCTWIRLGWICFMPDSAADGSATGKRKVLQFVGALKT